MVYIRVTKEAVTMEMKGFVKTVGFQGDIVINILPRMQTKAKLEKIPLYYETNADISFYTEDDDMRNKHLYDMDFLVG